MFGGGKQERKIGISRRKVLNSLSRSAITTVSAATFISKTARADNGNEVFIDFDIQGRVQEKVPKDWLNFVRRSRTVFNKVEDNWMEHRDVVGVKRSPGVFAGDNPHVIVEINENSATKDETRGKIPERRNEVDIRVTESRPGRELCGSDYRYGYELVCNNYDCSVIYPDPIPGGTLISVHSQDPAPGRQIGSMTSRILDENFNYNDCWLTAAHVIPNCNTDNVTVYHQAEEDDIPIGNVPFLDTGRDIAVINRHHSSASSETDAVSQVAQTPDNDDRFRIHGTVSQTGVDTWTAKENQVYKYGAGDCYGNGKAETVGSKALQNGTCTSRLADQFFWGAGGDAGDGDSGTLCFVFNDGEAFGISMANGVGEAKSIFEGRSVYGTVGYAIKDNFGLFWGDQTI